MAVNCDDCEHRGPTECYRGRQLFPPKCDWFRESRAKQEQEAEWDREADEWECDEEGDSMTEPTETAFTREEALEMVELIKVSVQRVILRESIPSLEKGLTKVARDARIRDLSAMRGAAWAAIHFCDALRGILRFLPEVLDPGEPEAPNA